MNKVISIHLRGVAFHLEEGGYDALRAYLDQAARQLATNPDKADILADIEQAAGDKFRALLNANHNVVLTAEVQAVIAEIGPVTDGSSSTEAAKSETYPADGPQPAKPSNEHPAPIRRLYRIKEGAFVSGVCNGLAAYLGMDVSLLRLAVVIVGLLALILVTPLSVVLMLVYFAAGVFIPEAKTPEQKAAAVGPSPTAQEFIRKGREGYYEGLKAFATHDARRAWKRKFRREMRQQRRSSHWGMDANFGVPPAPGVPPLPPSSDYYVGMPVLSLLKALLRFLGVFAVLSLLMTRSVFGLPLPASLPLWAGVILLVFAYKVLAAPLNALRHAYYFRSIGQPYAWDPFAGLWHGLLALVGVVFGIWIADHFIPDFHEALMNLPTFLQHAGETIQQWWNSAKLER